MSGNRYLNFRQMWLPNAASILDYEYNFSYSQTNPVFVQYHIVIYSKGLVAKDVGHTTVVQCIAESITNVPVEEMYETNSWYQ